MKQRRRDNHCLNCNLRIESIYNYCPQCGQENTNNRVSVLELLRDLYDDYITFDSRFFKSLKPFVFKPGELTNAFNEGHRIKYVHPVRFYILISLLYFFVFTHVFDFGNLPFSRLDALNDSLKREIQSDTVYNRGNELEKISDKLESLEEKLPKLKNKERITIAQNQITYLKHQLDSFQRDTTAIVSSKQVKKALLTLSKKADNDSVINNNQFGNDVQSWQKITTWLQDKKMKPEAFLDSLGVKEKGDIRIKFAAQALKIGRNDLSIFLQSAVDNIPIMMILLLPVMAFFLKVIYIRSDKLYIEHLVFAFHIQSFVYFILSVFLFLYYALGYTYLGLFISSFSLILLVYIYAMFRNVYKQGIFKTAFKATLLSTAYFYTLLIFLIIEIMVSFWLY